MKYFPHVKMKKLLLTSLCLFLSASAYSQGGNLFKIKNTDEESGKDSQTVIHSDAMDMDLAKSMITLLGNVDVQQPELNIKCRKMIIHLDKSDKTKNEDIQDEASNVRQIDCIGDVVITQRKKGEVTASQQAFAGKAEYYLKEEKIILTINPVVIKGPNKLEGEKITMFTQTDRIIVVRPVTTIKQSGK